MKMYLKNRENFPLDELAKYRGKYVAFSPVGSFIAAAHEDMGTLFELIDASGFPKEECVISGIVLFDDCDSPIGGFGAFG